MHNNNVHQILLNINYSFINNFWIIGNFFPIEKKMYPTIKINIHDTLLFFVTDQRYYA